MKLKNKKHISSAILAALLIAYTANNKDISLLNSNLLSPASLLLGKEKTLFLTRFNRTYENYSQYSNLSKQNREQLLKHINTKPDTNIKILLKRFFPDNPAIIDDYKWLVGLNICIGLNYQRNEAIIIPTGENTGIDFGIRKPLIVDINSLEADKFFTGFIDDMSQQNLLKKYMSVSGIDSLAGFLNHTGIIERFQAIEIFYNIFYNIDPTTTMHYILENCFVSDDTQSDIILDKLKTLQTDTELYNNISFALSQSSNDRMLEDHALKLLTRLIPLVDTSVVIESLSLLETKAPTSFTSINKILSEKYPEIFTQALEYFLANRDISKEYFLFQNIMQFTKNVKTEKMKDILADFINNKDVDKSTRLKVLNHINLFLPEIQLSAKQKNDIKETLLHSETFEYKSISAFINILKETNNQKDIKILEEIYNNKIVTSSTKTSIFLAMAFIGGTDATDFLIAEFDKDPLNKDLLELIALSDSPKAYETLYTKLLQSTNLTMRYNILKSLKKVSAENIPSSAHKDLITFLENQNNISDDLFKIIATIMAKADSEKTIDYLRKTIESKEISNSIKYAAFNILGEIKSPKTYTTIIALLKQKAGTTLAALNAFDKMDKTLFPKNAYNEIIELTKEYDFDLDIIFYTLKVLIKLENQDKYTDIYEKTNKTAQAIPEEDFSELYNDIIEKSNDVDLLLKFISSDITSIEVKKEALKKIRTLNVSLTQIQAIINIVHDKKTSITLHSYGANIIADNINKYYPQIKQDLIKSIKDEDTDYMLKVRYIEMLQSLDLKFVNRDIINAVKIFTYQTSIFNENNQAFNLLHKFNEAISDFAAEEENNNYLFQKFHELKNEEDKLDTLDKITFTSNAKTNSQIAENFLNIIADPKITSAEIKFTAGSKLIKQGGQYKKMLVDFIIPLVSNKDNLSPYTYKTYMHILQDAGANHKVLLLNKTMVDWKEFGISSKDIVKAFLSLKKEAKPLFTELINKVVDDSTIDWMSINWEESSDHLINETFFKIKKTATKRDIKRVFKALYSYLDLNLDTDILLGEEYEIVGRENVPEQYYEIYANGKDANEIITPPSNPLYQNLFSRHIPKQKAGIHRTVEQRVSYADAKLINLFCQMYALGNINQNISIGKEINPKSDSLWSIRYDTHATNSYGEGRYLLQTTDWKNHTSGSLMWFFINYADKFPLKWINLRNTMLKTLEEYNINIYQYNERGDEILAPIIKKHPGTNKEITIPKYIYDLTKFPDGQQDCVMRLIINDKEIVNALTEMVLYTSQNIVRGSKEEKKLLAFETLREIYKTVSQGEIPESFKIYRNVNAVGQSLEAMKDYFTDYNEKDLFSQKAKQATEQSI